MATFRYYGFTTAFDPGVHSPYRIRGPSGTLARVETDRTYENGDAVRFVGHGGSNFIDYTFHGVEKSTGYVILDRVGLNGFVILFGDTHPSAGSLSYEPDLADIDTTLAARIGNAPLFSDYGLRRPSGDTDEFTSQNREIEIDHGTYNMGDEVELRVLTRNADGVVDDIQARIMATFAGLDRETGNPLFNPVGGGRQILLASEKQTTYDIPLTDVVANDWLAVSVTGAEYANYGLRRENPAGDFEGDFNLLGVASFIGLDVASGLHDVGDILTIRPFGGVGDGAPVQVTVVGHEESTGYPIFEAADFDGAPAQFIVTDAMISGSYTPGTIVTDEPVGTGDAMFTNFAQRMGSEIGDGEFRIQDLEVKFAHGVYEVGNPVTLDFGVLGTQATTFVGYESDTGYPVFRSASGTTRLYVLVNENLPFDSIYTVDDLVTDMPYMTCFAPGTLIATPGGERAVETLKPGDKVLTADGEVVSVRFVGFQKVPTLFGPRELTHPVRIRAGALGENTPHTDLVVTKDHGMIVDGVICNAGALINGTSIVEVPTAELGTGPSGIATYYHVETEGHVPLLANGAVAESFIDEVDRAAFANHGEFVAMYGARVPDMTPMNLPRAMSMRQVPRRIRTRLGLPEYDATVIIPASMPSGVRRLWQDLRDWARSAGHRLARGLGIA